MPQQAACTVTWCETDQTYMVATGQGNTTLEMVPESPSWAVWLHSISSFAFHGKTGFYTARKERKPRGEGYWYAYARVEGKVTKRYLGPSSDLTLARLEQAAQELATSQQSEELHEEVGLVPGPVTSSAGRRPPRTTTVEGTFSAPTQPPPTPLVLTKVHAPHLRPSLVHRSRLTERLQQGIKGSLTLLSAPAGFGKTTLLTSWLASRGTPVAWFSVEPEDNDPARFFTYLLASLQRLDRHLGTSVLPLLQARQSIPLETTLALLINKLSTYEGPGFALVLDDYHVITAEPIHRALAYLVEHLPPQMPLVIATRADPPLPLARLRARGQMTEVRAPDLRFDQEEAEQFLRMVMGVDLSVQESALLQTRTEGWIAGLQFAALALRERPDVSTLIAAFAGTHRFVLDYLSEEVLMQQSPPVQKFLLDTCILDRLCGPLCDVVTGENNGQAMLEQLDARNLFLIALDDERRWYRYHHLFADVLRSRLKQTHPDRIPALHQRASTWYEENQLLIYAVQHALAASKFERAARLILQVDPSMVVRGEPLQMYLNWLNALPKEVMHQHPILSIYHAYLLLYLGQLEAAETRLQEAEAALQLQAPTDETQTHQGQIVTLRANIALYYGNIERCVELSRRALNLLPVKAFLRPPAIAMSVLAYFSDGNVTPTMERVAEEAVGHVQTSGNLSLATRSITNLARMRVLQGRLRQALATYEVVAQKVPWPDVLRTLPSGLSYYFGVGDIRREWNNLDIAQEYLAQGIAIVEGRTTADAPIIALGYTSLARLLQARGEYGRAFALLEQHAYLARQRPFMPYLLAQGAAVQTQIALAQGNIRTAIHWADGCSLSVNDDPGYLYEREYLTLARVRIAQGRANPSGPFLIDALVLLGRLLADAQSKARIHSAIEILVLRTLALHARGDFPAALNILKQALTLAEPEGYVRIFLDEGAPMLALLSQVGGDDPSLLGYVQRLLTHAQMAPGNPPTLTRDNDRSRNQALLDPLAPGNSPVSSPDNERFRNQALLDPLSERELEVIQLMAAGASNEEIAEHLVIAVGTAKRHVSNILAKLAVSNRTQAVARARELGLL
jgi:LuxR family maltose regulon positive regulatory protein